MILLWMITGLLTALVVFLLLACVALNVQIQALKAYQKHHDETMSNIAKYIQCNVNVMRSMWEAISEISKDTADAVAITELIKQFAENEKTDE